MFKSLAFAVLTLFTATAYSQSCHLRELDICAANLVAFATTESDEALTEGDLDRFCRFFGEVGDCFQSYAERCATDDMLDSMDPFLTLVDNFEGQLCTSNSSFRRTLMKQSKCMFQIGRNNKPCMRDVMASMEFLLTGNFNSSMRSDLGCCIFNRSCECNRKVAREHCGTEAADSLKGWTDEMSSRFGFKLFQRKCQLKLEGRESVCDVLQKPETWGKPKNKKAKSIIAKLVKQYNAMA